MPGIVANKPLLLLTERGQVRVAVVVSASYPPHKTQHQRSWALNRTLQGSFLQLSFAVHCPHSPRESSCLRTYLFFCTGSRKHFITGEILEPTDIFTWLTSFLGIFNAKEPCFPKAGGWGERVGWGERSVPFTFFHPGILRPSKGQLTGVESLMGVPTSCWSQLWLLRPGVVTSLPLLPPQNSSHLRPHQAKIEKSKVNCYSPL